MSLTLRQGCQRILKAIRKFADGEGWSDSHYRVFFRAERRDGIYFSIFVNTQKSVLWHAHALDGFIRDAETPDDPNCPVRQAIVALRKMDEIEDGHLLEFLGFREVKRKAKATS